MAAIASNSRDNGNQGNGQIVLLLEREGRRESELGKNWQLGEKN